MRYMMLIYSEEKKDIPFGTPEWDQLMVEYRAFGEEVRRRNAMVAADPLQSVETATTLRQQDGNTVMLDGPFAETREQLGGFYILDCKDKAEALELAAMIPSAKHGSIEVRQLFGHEQRFFEPPRQKHYMVLIYGDESKFLKQDDPLLQSRLNEHKQLTDDTIQSGEYVGGDALALTNTAVTVRVRDGQTIHTDGPFAETKEQLGGFYLFNTRDLDRAIELAKRIPMGPIGCLEVRPIQEV